MAYIAKRPCRFMGNEFKIGDVVPEEFILPGNAHNLVKMGTIADAGDGDYDPEYISVIVHADEGDIPLTISPEGIQAIFDVLGSNATDAKTIVEKMDEGDALILLHVSDSRKSVKEAAEARAKALNSESEDQ